MCGCGCGCGCTGSLVIASFSQREGCLRWMWLGPHTRAFPLGPIHSQERPPFSHLLPGMCVEPRKAGGYGSSFSFWQLPFPPSSAQLHILSLFFTSKSRDSGSLSLPREPADRGLGLPAAWGKLCVSLICSSTPSPSAHSCL